MKKADRKQTILEKINKTGRVLTSELAQEFQLTEDTIRKDLQELSKKGLVKRFHGGALRNEDNQFDFQKRLLMHCESKEALAIVTAQEILKYDLIFLDSGTTNLAVAKELVNSYEGTIITNSPPISLELSNNPDINIILIGGELDNRTKVIRNSHAIDQINQLNIQCTLLGVSDISIEKGITYPNQDEAFLKTALIKNSDLVIASVIKEKLDRYSAFYAADITAIDILITDEDNEDILSPYKEFINEIISI